MPYHKGLLERIEWANLELGMQIYVYHKGTHHSYRVRWSRSFGLDFLGRMELRLALPELWL